MGEVLPHLCPDGALLAAPSLPTIVAAELLNPPPPMKVQRVQAWERRRTRQVTAGLNLRIVVLAAIIVVQLWGLAAALQASLAGHGAEATWILGFELLAVAAALIIARSGVSEA